MKCLLSILLACAAASASAQTAIKFTSDWRIEGPAVFFLLPMYKGYFKDEGLDVSFDVGVGSAAAIQRIASGAYDIGSGDMTALIEYYGNNPGAQTMQAVYQIYESNPSAVFY
jgi:NitT/TauT family transport system substrate-binding protein